MDHNYEADARRLYGETEAYKEYEEKNAGRSAEQVRDLGKGFLTVFARFGELLSGNESADPAAPEAQALVKELQDYITEHFYTCTPEILAGLGKLYVSDRAFTENIDHAGAAGTAEFVSKAIEIYCK